MKRGGFFMSKMAVKYNNDLNTIPFRDFNATELDLFFTICSSVKEKGQEIIVFDFDTLKELSKYESSSIDRFVSDLQSTYSKLLKLSFTLDDGDVIESFTLFNRYKIIRSERTVEIQVHENFHYLLNDLHIGNYTRYELKEFTSLKSTYSKSIYRLLKQFKGTGLWKVSVIEFRRLLSVPKSYRMGNIDQQILKPAINELKPYFEGLNIKKIKANKGNRIEFFEFRFKQQDDKKEWLESSTQKTSKNKLAYGIYENVYLSEVELKTIVYDFKMKYLIDEVSEWKYKNNPVTNKTDFQLIETFKEKKNKSQIKAFMNLYE